ncbi:hypothetical protein Baya_13935 [Bagarius yarrelli]|uniref:Uncharacterized protein n=1 Tax=Bagarius yarrelli TaxID=175774 RepID=A0A556V7D3_BAGYA|nr:hypothetical protein Baya_13935 [Bagarius yarrelli]
MDSQIAKKNQSLTTAEEMRNQTKLVMQPYANWEEYLTPAPLSIAILGELVVISSNTDFSINKNPPKDGYKYIRYPESFRACLMQVCNSGWGAFNEAHKNMDQIRLHTLAVPDYMKTAVKILFQGNNEVVQALLPDQLENIRVIADDCLELATSTEKRFTDVINIVQELLEACLNAEQFYGEELNDMKKKLDEAKLRKQSSEEAAKRSEHAVKLMEKQMEEAHESYSKAMDSLPSGWDLIGMDLVESLTQGITTLVNGIASMAPQMLSMGSFALKNQITAPKSSADCIDEINIYSKSAEILSCTENIQGFIKGNTISWKELYDQKHQKTKTSFYEEQFKRIKQSLTESTSCEAKSAALTLCETAIGICEELAKFAPEGQCEETKTKELIGQIKNLNESAPNLYTTQPQLYHLQHLDQFRINIYPNINITSEKHYRYQSNLPDI